MSGDAELIERLCRVQHDAYEAAAARHGWVTHAASRVPWGDVPEPNKATMRASMEAVLDELARLEADAADFVMSVKPRAVRRYKAVLVPADAAPPPLAEDPDDQEQP